MNIFYFYYLFLLALTFMHCIKTEPNLPNIEKAKIEEVENRTVYIHSAKLDRPNGTGILIDKQGTVLTCLHTISAIEDSLQVMSHDGIAKYSAKILFKQELFDLVLLETDFKTNVAPVHWVPTDELAKGERVFLIGAPYGLINSFMLGVISEKSRVGASLQFPTIPYIQVQGITYPGNSGAVVFNSKGQAIGINQAAFGFTSGTGIGLVIPYGFIQVFLDEAKKNSNQLHPLE